MPPVVAVLPIYIMFQKLHLLDTHRGADRHLHGGEFLPIVVWLMRDFSAGIPIHLEESAQIDGASKLRIFFTIALPLARSGLVAVSMLVLILCWNEYLLALFLSNAKAQTMPVLVSAQNGTRGPQMWPVRGAPTGWPVSAFHSRTVPSQLAEASRCPSGLNATLVHRSRCGR